MAIMLIVKGAGSRGKTSTLKNLINNLLDGKEPLLREPTTYGNDTLVITERNGMKIGIITLGDPGCTDYVRDKVEYCHTEGVDFIVAASRTKYRADSVYKFLWDYAHDKNYITFETSTIVKYDNWGKHVSADVLNKICAENILNIIDHANEIEK